MLPNCPPGSLPKLYFYRKSMVVPIALYSTVLRIIIIAIVIKVSTYAGKILWEQYNYQQQMLNILRIFIGHLHFCVHLFPLFSFLLRYSYFFLFIFKRFCFQCLGILRYTPRHTHKHMLLVYFLVCNMPFVLAKYTFTQVLRFCLIGFVISFLFTSFVCAVIQNAVSLPEIC